MTKLPEAVERKIEEIGPGHTLGAGQRLGAREMAEWLCEGMCSECGKPWPCDERCWTPDGFQSKPITRAEYLRRHPK